MATSKKKPRRMRARPPLDEVPDGLVERISAQIDTRGAVTVKQALRTKLTRRAEAELVDQLARRNYERTAKHFRRPLPEQILTKLAQTETIPTKQLRKHLGGVANVSELKLAIKGLIASGDVCLVWDDGKEILTLPSSELLNAEELQALAALSTALGKLVRNVKARATRLPRTLRRDRVVDLLSGVLRNPTKLIMQVIEDLEDPDTRIVFIPKLAEVTGLPTETLHRTLRELSRAGLIELRPESGTRWMNPGDRALCPTLDGALLSKVRSLTS